MGLNSQPICFLSLEWQGKQLSSNNKPTPGDWLSFRRTAQPHPWPHRHPLKPPGVCWPRCVPHRRLVWLGGASCSVLNKLFATGPTGC